MHFDAEKAFEPRGECVNVNLRQVAEQMGYMGFENGPDSGWTETLVDLLEEMYGLESGVSAELRKLNP
jgi:hypothetical protein